MCLNKVGVPAPPGLSPSPCFPGMGGGSATSASQLCSHCGKARARCGTAGTWAPAVSSCSYVTEEPEQRRVLPQVRVPQASKCSTSPRSDLLLMARTKGQPMCDLIHFVQVTPENSGPSWRPGPERRHVPKVGIQPAIQTSGLPGGQGEPEQEGQLGGPYPALGTLGGRSY